jgi:signal recognition particle receptor subunit beta
MAMVGDLQEFSLCDLLHLIERGRKTGQLSIWAPNGIYRIWFYQGRVVTAIPPQPEHSLENLLANSRGVRGQDVARSTPHPLNEPLGHCLQRQGLITPAALAKLFRHQLQTGLYSLFALESGQFSFLPNVPMPYREMTGLSKDEVAELKKTTTVSMDFGRLRIGEEEEEMWLHLYGTPGQSRFNFMWDILIKRAHGYVLLVPAHLPGQFRNAQAIQSFMKARTSAPCVIGITHVDQPNAWDPEDILLILGNQDGAIPHTTLNAQEPASVANTLLLLVEQMMPQVVV